MHRLSGVSPNTSAASLPNTLPITLVERRRSQHISGCASQHPPYHLSGFTSQHFSGFASQHPPHHLSGLASQLPPYHLSGFASQHASSAGPRPHGLRLSSHSFFCPVFPEGTHDSSPPLQSSKGYWSHCFSSDVDYWSRCSTPHFPHFPTPQRLRFPTPLRLRFPTPEHLR